MLQQLKCPDTEENIRLLHLNDHSEMAKLPKLFGGAVLPQVINVIHFELGLLQNYIDTAVEAVLCDDVLLNI